MFKKTTDFPYDLADMEGMIGGSAIDELRDLMDIDNLEDNDIVFKLISDPSIALNLSKDYKIPNGYTFLAHCLKHNIQDFKYVIDSEDKRYYTWKPI